MTVTEEPRVLVADAGAVRTITLNRPAVRNAIDIPLRIALAEAIEAADATPSVRAIVLTGAGSGFCSGGDVSTMRRVPEDEARPRAAMAQRVIRAIWTTPKPVVAAVAGPAYGAGASLALACDRVVADTTARFSTAFANVGLAGDMGIFASLPARVGVARAKQMLMFPTPLDAVDAAAIGLVDVVVSEGAALSRAVEDATRLARGPAQALGVVKDMLGHARDRLQVLDEELAHQVALFGSDDFGEAVTAFAEKRTPDFTRSSPPPQ